MFKGEVAVESKGLKIPFLGIEIGGRLGVEGTLLGVEARAHAGVSYTKKDGFRAGAGGKISAFLAGLGINFEIFIRPIKDTSAPPDTLATGYPTVLIGPAANTAPLFSDEYLARLVGKHIAGADSPELKAAMDTLWKHRHEPDNPLVADALQALTVAVAPEFAILVRSQTPARSTVSYLAGDYITEVVVTDEWVLVSAVDGLVELAARAHILVNGASGELVVARVAGTQLDAARRAVVDEGGFMTARHSGLVTRRRDAWTPPPTSSHSRRRR
ncbi:hypothetical protein [Nannocystis sp.]|uniref:hypothetical protein n=1 Tax=Nannocystis sp. TaxID=1962667 RepID=UPI0025ECA168|nr:hypothetical protein [Nannocystis sp.]MBK7827159.1 hypothetical protein [Nannocystis sp.]